VDALYEHPDDPLRRAHEWLVTDTPVTRHREAGRRVGTSLAADLERRVVELRHLDDVVAGGRLHPIVHRELSDTWRVLNEASYSQQTGARLLTVTGELAQLAGWAAWDAGYQRQGQHEYLSGVTAAREAGDDVLVGQLLSCLAYHLATTDDPADAELLARSALAGTGNATPVARALFLERLAWACARAGNEDGARRPHDNVDDSYEARDTDTAEPEWVYWLDRSEIDIMAGRCLVELGNPAQAEPLLVSAISGYEPEHAREVALFRTWLAEAYARSGEFDAARTTLCMAERTAHDLSSARLGNRVAAIAELIRL